MRTWHRILSAQSAALDDASLEYFFFQTLLGSYPDTARFELSEYRERLSGAIIKAAREARRHTSWSRPNDDFEARIAALIDGALASQAFLDDFRPFQQRVARAGVDNSLVQTALKLTVPGVPDIYQGAELWDLSLVDPDNRRAVDYPLRRRMLDELLARWKQDPATTISEAMTHWQDGRIKMLLTAVLLRLRAEYPAWTSGEYLPCEVPGRDDRGAFVRRSQEAAVLVTFRRSPLARGGRRAAPIELPTGLGEWRDVLRPGPVIQTGDLGLDIELPVGVYVSSSL